MSIVVPRLRLTHGQVAWIVSGGQPASAAILAQLRYLRTLKIPFADKEQDSGRGHRMIYSFYELVEVGIAFEALRRGVMPRHLKQLVDERKAYRRFYRFAYSKIPESAYAARWAKSRGAEIELTGESWHIEIEGRFGTHPGQIEMIPPGTKHPRGRAGERVATAPGQADRVVIEIRSVMVPLMAWAKEAPFTRTGPKG